MTSLKKDSLALFDFDGTVSTKDSFFRFIIFSNGWFYSAVGFIVLLPVFFLFKVGLITTKKAKEIIFSFFYRNLPFNRLKQQGRDFTRFLEKSINPLALEKINWHKNQEHEVCIVTASSDIWLEEWCNKYDIPLICTKYEINNGKFTGKIEGHNCTGKEKASRIKEQYDLANYETIYAYGNSKGDMPMLDLADQKFYNRFS